MCAAKLGQDLFNEHNNTVWKTRNINWEAVLRALSTRVERQNSQYLEKYLIDE